MTKKRQNLRERLKRTVIVVYGVTVLVIAVALYQVLGGTSGLLPPPTVVETDPEILAVVDAMESGNVTIPISDIEKLIPVRREPSWRVHAASWQPGEKPMISIVIDDLGLAEAASEKLATMPGPYTLAYLPYADALTDQTRLVRSAGHELMVHLPMEPKGAGADPGRNALLSGLTHREFERRIAWNLNRFEGFVGVNNHMGSLVTENAGQMVRVMVHLKRDGYLFLDSLTSPKSVGVRAARATGVPHIARDIFLDNIQRQRAVEKQLRKVESIARRRGYAVAIGHPYKVTLDALAIWQQTLDARGLLLVPVSQLVARINERERLASLEVEAAR